MTRGVDLATEHLLGAADSERSDLRAQDFLRLRRQVRDFGFGCRTLARGFGERVVLGLVDDLGGLLVRLVGDLSGVDARLADLVGDAGVGIGEFLLGTIGSGETVGDLLLAFFDGIAQLRPDLGRDDPDEACEHERLREQRQVDVHGVMLRMWTSATENPVARSNPG